MSGRRQTIIMGEDLPESRKTNGDSSTPKRGLGPRPVGGAKKLGMFSGVFVPTCLNVLSILMFLRFGLILGTSYYCVILSILNPVLTTL
jgi:potassium/chloride transporter 9